MIESRAHYVSEHTPDLSESARYTHDGNIARFLEWAWLQVFYSHLASTDPAG